MGRRLLILIVTLLILVLFTQPAVAEETQQLRINWLEGPAQVEMGENLAQLKLPENYVFAKPWILAAAGLFALFLRIRYSFLTRKRAKQKAKQIEEMTEEVTTGQTEKTVKELTAEEALVEREG